MLQLRTAVALLSLGVTAACGSISGTTVPVGGPASSEQPATSGRSTPAAPGVSAAGSAYDPGWKCPVSPAAATAALGVPLVIAPDVRPGGCAFVSNAQDPNAGLSVGLTDGPPDTPARTLKFQQTIGCTPTPRDDLASGDFEMYCIGVPVDGAVSVGLFVTTSSTQAYGAVVILGTGFQRSPAEAHDLLTRWEAVLAHQ